MSCDCRCHEAELQPLPPPTLHDHSSGVFRPPMATLTLEISHVWMPGAETELATELDNAIRKTGWDINYVGRT